jgi:flagellar motor switch protein FliN/FliY
MTNTTSRIATHIEASFGQAAAGLTGRDFIVTLVETPAVVPVFEEPILWQQTFSVLDAPSLWICAGKDLWETLSRITLEAAGIAPITAEDSRSTWQEIVGQTIGGVASALTADLLREVTAAKGEVLDEERAELANATWTYYSVSDGQDANWVFRAAWSVDLAALYNPQPAEERVRPHTDGVSKTFDLLLDVSLPVSVSFGKTSLQIREVLKLNTGSIVELNRLVTDPVDVIVNDCVIARGEVVVVDGNYGVRISQLATREDRLRTGIGNSPRLGARP